MKRLIRRLSRVADSSSHHHRLLDKEEEARPSASSWLRIRRRWRPEVPEGHVPVRVGEEGERFVVRAELLGRPAFAELLRLSAMEYGYEQCGVLRIPCPVELFRRLLVCPDDGELHGSASPPPPS